MFLHSLFRLFHHFLLLLSCPLCFFFFFFNDTPTTEIYTLSLHDALPICPMSCWLGSCWVGFCCRSESWPQPSGQLDRKSTRLNSSHRCISYAVFCLKKKKKI